MRFVVIKAQGSQVIWWDVRRQQRDVAWAGETFDSSCNADRAASAFEAGAATARYEIYAEGTVSTACLALERQGRRVRRESLQPGGRARATQNVRDNAGQATGH